MNDEMCSKRQIFLNYVVSIVAFFVLASVLIYLSYAFLSSNSSSENLPVELLLSIIVLSFFVAGIIGGFVTNCGIPFKKFFIRLFLIVTIVGGIITVFMIVSIVNSFSNASASCEGLGCLGLAFVLPILLVAMIVVIIVLYLLVLLGLALHAAGTHVGKSLRANF